MVRFVRLVTVAVVLAVAAPAAAPDVAPVRAISAVVAVPDAAQAAAITVGYCEYSLRGGGSLEPDPDIKEIWDLLERSGFGNVYHSEYTGQYYYLAEQSVHIKIQYTATKDGYTRFRSAWFQCWRDNWSPSGRYNDSFEAWG